jgi:stage V sporulation protein S
MNRFFSKLDLRDIKIDPRGSHFPPDGDEEEVVDDGATTDEESYQDLATYEAQPEVEPEPVAPASQNGHAAFDAAPSESENGRATVEAVATTYTHEQGDEVLKVSARSRPSAVAGAIAGVVREYGRAEVQAIGAGATNQAVKAAAIARDYLLETGIDAVCLPAFIDVTIENEDRTAMRLLIEPR